VGSVQNDSALPRNMLYVLSSADQAGLSRIASALGDNLDARFEVERSLEETGVNWSGFDSSLAYTLGSRRSALDHRTFIVSKSTRELSAQLRKPLPSLKRTAKNNNIFFIFTGQGMFHLIINSEKPSAQCACWAMA
jgi:acyl transferase domain-containing protein